jgi:O-antigen/teichoic acid export membrane protein
MTEPADLPRGLVVARNIAYNFGAQIWLTILALVTTPYIIGKLGVDQYGLYVVVLAVVGYFTFLDLGFGVATVKYLSEFHGRERTEVIRNLIGTTTALYVVAGGVGGLVIAVLSSWFATTVLSVPGDLSSLARTALYVTAIVFVVNMPGLAFMSVPIALQRFDITGKATVFVGTASALGAVTVLWLGYGLIAILLVNVAIFALTTILWILVARRLLPATPILPRFDRPSLRLLTRFGGLKFLQQVTTHSIFHIDKFLLGALASLAAVSYYAVPLHLVQRLLLVVGNVGAAFFPAASQLHGEQDTDRLNELYLRSTKLVALLMVPAASMLFIFSDPILTVWIGDEFADESSVVLKVLAVSYLIAAFATLPGMAADAVGRPGVTALFSTISLATNLAASLILIPHYEALGAAFAIAINAAIQVPVFVYYVHSRVIRVSILEALRSSVARPVLAGVLAWPVMILFASLAGNVFSLLALLAASMLVYLGTSALVKTYDARDRALVRRVLSARSG